MSSDVLERHRRAAGDVHLEAHAVTGNVLGGVDVVLADVAVAAKGCVVAGEHGAIVARAQRVGGQEEVRRDVYKRQGRGQTCRN